MEIKKEITVHSIEELIDILPKLEQGTTIIFDERNNPFDRREISTEKAIINLKNLYRIGRTRKIDCKIFLIGHPSYFSKSFTTILKQIRIQFEYKQKCKFCNIYKPELNDHNYICNDCMGEMTEKINNIFDDDIDD